MYRSSIFTRLPYLGTRKSIAVLMLLALVTLVIPASNVFGASDPTTCVYMPASEKAIPAALVQAKKTYSIYTAITVSFQIGRTKISASYGCNPAAGNVGYRQDLLSHFLNTPPMNAVAIRTYKLPNSVGFSVFVVKMFTTGWNNSCMNAITLKSCTSAEIALEKSHGRTYGTTPITLPVKTTPTTKPAPTVTTIPLPTTTKPAPTPTTKPAPSGPPITINPMNLCPILNDAKAGQTIQLTGDHSHPYMLDPQCKVVDTIPGPRIVDLPANVTIQAAPGANPLIMGSLQIVDAQNWTINNVDFTSLPVKTGLPPLSMLGGNGWRVTGSEIYNSGGYTDLQIGLIQGQDPDGTATNYRVDHNFIHDNLGDPTHEFPQDHNIYIIQRNGVNANALVDENVVVGSAHGDSVKIGGTGTTATTGLEGTDGVTLRNNTIVNDNSAGRDIMVPTNSDNITLENNILYDKFNSVTDSGLPQYNISLGSQFTGDDTIIRNNAFWGFDTGVMGRNTGPILYTGYAYRPELCPVVNNGFFSYKNTSNCSTTSMTPGSLVTWPLQINESFAASPLIPQTFKYTDQKISNTGNQRIDPKYPTWVPGHAVCRNYAPVISGGTRIGADLSGASCS